MLHRIITSKIPGALIAIAIVVFGVSFVASRTGGDPVALGTLRTADLIVENTVGVGHVPITSTSFTAYGATAAQTTLAWFQSSGTSHVGGGGINEAIPIVIRNDATFDTTALAGYSAGIDLVVSSSRAAGANPLVNKGIFVQASGGQTNLAIDVGAGTSNFQDANFAGNTAITGTATFSTAGTTTLGDSVHNTTVGHILTVNGAGNLTTAAQVNGDVVVGVSAASSTVAKVRINTQNGQDALQLGGMAASAGATQKYWSLYPSTGTLKLFEYNDATAPGGAGNDRMFIKSGGEIDLLGKSVFGTANTDSTTFTGHWMTTGTAITTGDLSSCGTTPAIATGSTDLAGRITEGTTATGCTLTFKNTYTNSPFCVCSGETSGAAALLVGCHTTATTLVIVNASATGDLITYNCTGRSGGT